MSRWLARLLLWPLIILSLAFGALPFTGWGSRTLVETAARLLPLEIGYGGGTLAGELYLTRLGWSSEGMRLELQDMVAEFSPSCLWYSRICFDELQAQGLDIQLLPGPGGTASGINVEQPVVPLANSTMVVIPVAIEAASVVVENTVIRWQGGQWSQGRMQGSVALAGSTITVGSTEVVDARLDLQRPAVEEPPSLDPVVMPRIDLPLELAVEDLQLVNPSWSVYGREQQLQILSLRGHWRNVELRLQQLDIDSAELGELSLQGSLDLAGQWPLELDAQVVVEAVPQWPALFERESSLHASGELNALELELSLPGAVSLELSAQLDALDRDLPFKLSGGAHWEDALALNEQVPLPEPLADLVLETPLQLSASGSLQTQTFQLSGEASGMGYQAMAIQLAGALQANTLTVEDLRLQDASGDNTLWGKGQLSFGEQLLWSARLESSGFKLPQTLQYAQGDLAGHLQLSGSSSAQDWELAVAEVDLRGTVNGLPALLGGHGGLRQGFSLLASDLRAEVNGAQLSLQASGKSAEQATVNIEVPELQRWQADSRGRLALQATVAPDWQQLAFTGSVEAIQWGALRVAGGDIKGSYQPGQNRSSNLEVDLSTLAVAGLEVDILRLQAADTGSVQTLTLHTQGDIEGELGLRGAFTNGVDWSGQLAPTHLKSTYGGWKLDDAVALDWSGSAAALRIASHCWINPQTRICPGEFVLGAKGSGSLAVDGGLEFLAALFPEEVEVTGELQSTLVATWAPDAPLALEGKLDARDVRITRHYGLDESTSVNWETATAVIQQSEKGLQLDMQMHRQGRRALELEALLPMSRDGPLEGILEFQGLRLSTLAPFAPNLANLEGELTGSLQLQGTVNEPLGAGTVTLSDGRFVVVGNPTELRQVELVIDVEGDSAKVIGSGELGGGKLNIKGMLLSDPEPRLELVMSGNKQELLLPPSTRMSVSENIELILTGELLDIKGDISVHEGVLQHEQLPAGSVDISADVVEVDSSGKVIRQWGAFDTRINVAVLIEDNFKVEGDMVDATVGGDLRLLQDPGQPSQVFGNLAVIGGELRAFGQLLRIRRGTIAFSGRPDNPEFDVRAQRALSGESVVVGVQLQGTMMQPKLEVYSEPTMPHGEAMSYLLRGRGLDTGADADGMAMALTVGSGVVNRSTLVEELNRIPGVSNLAFGAEGTDQDTAATVGGYLGNRLYLSYGMGLYEPVNVLTARLYLQTRLWLEVVSRLENSVDLYYSFYIK